MHHIMTFRSMTDRIYNSGPIVLYYNIIQWNLDLLFFKGVEKTNDEYGETINPENHFFLTKKVIHCLLRM
jgi:hypothetical protein